MAAKKPVAGFDYEKARVELEGIVRSLENGSNTLEENLALWEKGEQLAAKCQEWLDEINEKLQEAKAEISDEEDEEEYEDEELEEDDE